MKKSLLFAFLLATICIVPQCKKDPSGQNVEPITDKITFGDTVGMHVVKYDSTFFRYYTPHEEMYPTFEIDILTCDTFLDFNNDGNEDIHFSSGQGKFWLFQEVYNDEYFSIRSISNSTILGDLYCDQVSCDVYRHSDTTILQTNDTTVVVVEHFNNYKPISESDPNLYTYKTSIIHPCNAGDQLSKDAYFDRHPRPVYTFPYEAYGEEYHTNDTIYYQATYDIDNPSFDFPLDEEKYIGFKIREKDGANKLGWLKIKLISKPDGTHRLRLLETAIQK